MCSQLQIYLISGLFWNSSYIISQGFVKTHIVNDFKVNVECSKKLTPPQIIIYGCPHGDALGLIPQKVTMQTSFTTSHHGLLNVKFQHSNFNNVQMHRVLKFLWYPIQPLFKLMAPFRGLWVWSLKKVKGNTLIPSIIGPVNFHVL